MTTPAPDGDDGMPDAAWTLPEVLARRAESTPDEPAVAVVTFPEQEPTAEPRSYADVFRGVRGAAGVLHDLGVQAGDRVVLSVAHPARFLECFVGAECLGAVPVPLPPLAGAQTIAYLNRIRSASGDAAPRAVLADVEAVDALRSVLGTSAPVRDAASVAEAAAGGVFEPRRDSREPAFLQYTSGSTGEAKGVVVRHDNLLANLRALIRATDMSSADVVFSWLPLFHDMGLVAGLLLGQYLGMRTYVAAPRTFIGRPESWLRAVSRFRATISPAPNFAFHVLAQRVRPSALAGLDLSSWRLAFDGAELVDPVTAHRFIERFGPYGFRRNAFRAAYGMAECTLTASVPPSGADSRFDTVDRRVLAEQGFALPCAPGTERSVTYAGVGKALPGHRLLILAVDSDRKLPERHLGEIVLSGPSVTPGYHRDLARGAPARTELRTGDIGYLADGELYVVDRLKDLLVVSGRKYAPTDIERVVGTVGGVRAESVVAFSVRNDGGTEDPCVAVALDPRGLRDRGAVVRQVRGILLRHFGLSGARIQIVRPGDIPRTSSGKLRRLACRDLLTEGASAAE